MKMITLFLPEKYLEMLDTLVASNLYPNRSEALRMATWKFLHESVSMLKVSASNAIAKAKNATIATSATSAKKEATPEPETEQEEDDENVGSSELDDALDEIDASKRRVTPGTSTDADPFDEIVREQQHA
jgi:Arc/MetJ-type ribon-helix-helix transcriptional regulator